MRSDHRVWRRVYGGLIRLMPRGFRERNGTELRELLDRRLESWAAESGMRVHARAACECADLLGQVLRLRLAGAGHREWGDSGRRVDAWFTLRDVRHAVRGLRRAPGFTAPAMLTVALSVGVTATMFAVAWGVWLKPLPYVDTERLVSIRGLHRDGASGGISSPELDALKASGAFSGIGVYAYGAAVVHTGPVPERVVSYMVSADFFEVLGVHAAAGRTFADSDLDDSGAVVVLSNGFWRRQFGGDASIVGNPLESDGVGGVVLGVMSPDFDFPVAGGSAMWRLVDPRWLSSSGNQRSLHVVARLLPGETLERSRAIAESVATRLAAEAPETNAGWTFEVTPLVDESMGPYRPALRLLAGSVMLVLAIACANLLGLFLVRNIGRRRELSVRTALGAGRWQVRRLLLGEGLIVALVGGMAGLLLASLGTSALRFLLPAYTPRLSHLGIDGPVALFAAVVTLMTGLIAGLAISGDSGDPDVAGPLRLTGRTAGGIRSRRFRSRLVVAEVALSMLLLVGAGLMVRSLLDLLDMDRGYRPDQLLTAHVTVPFDRFGSRPTAPVFNEVESRLSRIAGVVSVGSSTGFPGSALGVLGGASLLDPVEPDRQVPALIMAASPDCFRAMGAVVVSGRSFTATDGPGSPLVAIVNRTLASRLWPGDDVVGKRIQIPASAAPALGMAANEAVEVVGVVGDMHIGTRTSPELYFALRQAHAFWVDVVIRTSVDPTTRIREVRQTLRDIEPDFLIEELHPMTAVISSRFALERTQSFVVGLFGALAVALTAIGLYGLLSQGVAERIPELAIRRALGATTTGIIRQVFSHGMLLTVGGVTIGSVLALVAIRLLRNHVFGLAAVEWPVMVGAALALVVVAMIAGSLPARAAIRVHPIRALR